MINHTIGRKCLSLLPALVFTISLSAQEPKMNRVAGISTVDLVPSYLDSAQLLSNRAPLRAIDQINKAIEASIRNHDKTTEGLSYCILGNIQQNLGQHDLAVENYQKSIRTLLPFSSYNVNSSETRFPKKVKKISGYELTDSRIDPSLFASYKRMAFSLLQISRLSEAYFSVSNCLTDRFTGISNNEKQDARRIQASILLKQGKQEDCLTILLNILEEEKKLNNPEGETKTLMSLASFYEETKREEKAIEYYQSAKMVAEKINNSDLLLSINNSLASLFRQQNNIDKELEIQANSMEINKAWSSSYAVRIADNSSLESKSSPTSADQAVLTDPLIEKSKGMEFTANTYKLLAEQALKEGNSPTALHYFKSYTQMQDSIQLTRKKELDQALKIGNALGKNQQRMDLLEKERDLSDRSIAVLKQDQELKENELYIRNVIIGTLLFLIVFLLGSGYFIFKSIRAKRRANQLLAIKSLRGQMNPHFIFNALNSVNHYISQNDERAANKYLSDFSKLMRAVMETSKHDLISLAKELDILKIYLQLEHSRFPDKFNYTFKVEETIDPTEFKLPPMLVQPFIENAVWHGLRYMDEKGILTITIGEQAEDLIITVKDNGIGRKKSGELKTKNQKLQNSTGMQNIENRIEIMNELYKTKIHVEISDAYPEAINIGTLVKIFIPKNINHHA